MAASASNIAYFLRKYVEVAFYLALGAWLIFAFASSVYFYKSQSRGWFPTFSKLPMGAESADLEITSVNAGEIYGNIRVYVKTERVKDILKEEGKMYVQYFTVNDNPQYGVWRELKVKEAKYDGYVLKSEKDIKLYSLKYEINRFPFDIYHITFDPSLILINKTGDLVYEEPISNRQVKITNLPYPFIADNKITDLAIKRLLKVMDHSGGVTFVIKRPLWFLWLFGGVLGFLLIPVMILIHSEIKSMSFDVIALVVSFMSVRSFFVEEIKAIYPIDAYFCFLILSSGLIVIYKLCRQQLHKK